MSNCCTPRGYGADSGKRVALFFNFRGVVKVEEGSSRAQLHQQTISERPNEAVDAVFRSFGPCQALPRQIWEELHS